MLLSFIISFKRTNRITYFIDDWEQRKSKEVCSISTGKSNTQDKVEDGDYPFYVRSAIIERSNKYLYDEEAVLTVGDGVGTGKVYHLVNGKYDLHQRVYRMFDFNHGITIEYFFYYFSKNFYKRVQAMTAKTSVDSVRLEMIAEMKINYPNQNEQIKIGNFFKQLDDTITLQERKLSLLKLMKKGFLQQLFPKNEQVLPDIRFTNFQEVWEKRKLGNIVEIIMGQSPNSENYTDNPLDNILVQGNADMKNGRVVPRVWTKQITKKAERNDLILSVRAPVGDIGKTDYSIVIGRGVAAIRGNEFIFQTLGKMKIDGYWNKLSTGSTFESINSNDIKEAQIKITNIKEQTKIGNFFKQLDETITLQEKKIDQLKQIKKALLQKMFI